MQTWIQKITEGMPEVARQRRSVARGDYLFRHRQPAEALFIVVEGRVRMFRELADGTAVTLHVAREGETFAEAALFATNYHCHALAELDTTVICLSTQELMSRLQTDAALGLELSRHLAHQVRDLRAMVCLRDIRSADERLLNWLRQKADNKKMQTVLDRSWTAISQELGLTRETVYRSLARLEELGLISRERTEGGALESIQLRRN